MPVTRSGKRSVAFGPSPSKNEDTVDLTMTTSPPGVKCRKNDGGNDENRAHRSAEDKKVVTTGALRRGIQDKTNFQQSTDTKEQKQQHLDPTRNNGSSAKVYRISQIYSTSFRNRVSGSEGDQHDPIVGKRESRISQANALIDRAKEAYTQSEYDLSIQLYTEAVTLFDSGHSIPLSTDDKELLVMVFGMRAEALIKVGAYGAASAEYAKAVGIINTMLDLTTCSIKRQGLELSVLLARYSLRQGCSLLKMGKDIEADEAYARIIVFCDAVLGQLRQLKALYPGYFTYALNADYMERRLRWCKENALRGTKHVDRYRNSLLSASQEEEQSLAFLDKALVLAPASLEAIFKKISILASHERWTHVRFVIESLACETVKCSGVCFVADLTEYDPFPRAPKQCVWLRTDSLTTSTSTISSDGKYRTLGANEATEVPWRIPTNVRLMYVRSLYMEQHLSEARNIATLSIQVAGTVKEKEALKEELNILDKVTSMKSEGDRSFLLRDYVKAVRCYSVCSETLSSEGIHGGKLHAVLLCNRAASYVAMEQYEDAARDCTAALEIRPNYLKVRLRKARSLEKLGRFKESEIEYWAWKSAVKDGKARPDSSKTIGSLEALKDITDEELQRVNDECQKVMQAARQQKAACKRREDAKTLEDVFHRL